MRRKGRFSPFSPPCSPPTTPTKSKSQCYRIHFIHEHASVTNTILIYRVLFPHSVFHLGFGVFLSGEVWCVPSASPLYGGRCLTQLSLFSSDLVNGLVALMNSNVSSPVNLVSTVLPSPLQQLEGLSWRALLARDWLLWGLLSTQGKQSRGRH